MSKKTQKIAYTPGALMSVPEVTQGGPTTIGSSKRQSPLIHCQNIHEQCTSQEELKPTWKKVIAKANRLTYEEQKLNEPIIDRNDEREIFADMSKWKEKYYNYFDIKNDKMIDLMSKNYVESFIWTANYYLNECINWTWSYNYCVAPSLYHLYRYLEKIDDLKIEKNNDKITPYRQLQLVLPESSFHLSKRKINKLKKLNYPTEFIKCHLLKRYDWESYILNL